MSGPVPPYGHPDRDPNVPCPTPPSVPADALPGLIREAAAEVLGGVLAAEGRAAMRAPTDSESPDAPYNPDVWELRSRLTAALDALDDAERQRDELRQALGRIERAEAPAGDDRVLALSRPALAHLAELPLPKARVIAAAALARADTGGTGRGLAAENAELRRALEQIPGGPAVLARIDQTTTGGTT